MCTHIYLIFCSMNKNNLAFSFTISESYCAFLPNLTKRWCGHLLWITAVKLASKNIVLADKTAGQSCKKCENKSKMTLWLQTLSGRWSLSWEAQGTMKAFLSSLSDGNLTSNHPPTPEVRHCVWVTQSKDGTRKLEISPSLAQEMHRGKPIIWLRASSVSKVPAAPQLCDVSSVFFISALSWWWWRLCT